MSSTSVVIGGKEQVFETSFLTVDDQDVAINISVPPVALQLAIRFTQGGLLPPSSPTGRWEMLAGILRFTFTGWTNVLTSAIGPQRFGEANGRGIYFQMAHRKIGANLNEVHWWVLLESQP